MYQQSTDIFVVRHHESRIMSEKQYFSFWQIWILQILCFKSIYNLPITFPLPQKKRNYGKLEIQLPECAFLASWAINMISDFIRVTWWRTTFDKHKYMFPQSMMLWGFITSNVFPSNKIVFCIVTYYTKAQWTRNNVCLGRRSYYYLWFCSLSCYSYHMFVSFNMISLTVGPLCK